ncbi:MAG TPA: hypothetical protein QGF58_10105 [Myxococcota bacterium]|nr:hypothetical protein [Myxococcota bacterium]
MDWRTAATRLAGEAAFRGELSEAIRGFGYAGLFWECRPFTTGEEPFEYVVLESRAVARLRVDPRPFAAELRGAVGPVAAFDNLGGDARLVAPTAPHAHLAAFLREGSDPDIDAFWQRVGVEASARMGRRTWVSTSGLGVSWLHVRLDDRPKYYTHRPYSKITG